MILCTAERNLLVGGVKVTVLFDALLLKVGFVSNAGADFCRMEDLVFWDCGGRKLDWERRLE